MADNLLNVLSESNYAVVEEPIYRPNTKPMVLIGGSKKTAYLILKRTMDIVLSLLALVVLSPALLIIALIIYIDDPHGSPIFVQDRSGKDGKQFRFYKYRSMVIDAEERLKSLKCKNEMDGPVFKIRDDPRVTRIGRFIRKTSIDELPQLINVLRGDMSLVGPRPPLPREVEQYGDYEMQRLLVKPGLTCFWQVSGRNEIGFDEWVELDLKYIWERNTWIDIGLIFKTIGVVFSGTGH